MSTPSEPARRLRAVLYLRQSIAKEDSISLELQEDAGRRYADQQGYQVIAVEADEGISGRTWNRPAVQRVMTMIEKSEADVIILWKWSRLSRQRLDWAVAIDKVESVGGRIESATEQVDVSTSTGRFARGMLAEFAAFESERIGDTWKEAHRRRVDNGMPANGKKRFGYQYDRATGFTPHPVEGPTLQECYRRYLTGASFYDITQYLNDGPTRPGEGYTTSRPGLWSTRTVRRVMDNPFSTGKFHYKGEIRQGTHEPLIDEATWEEYQVRRKKRAVYRNGEKGKYLFSGFVHCAICGYGMYPGLFGTDRLPKYRCHGSGHFRLHKGGYVMEAVLNQELKTWLTTLADEINAAAKKVDPQPPKTQDPTPQLRRALMKVDSRLDTLTTRLLDGTVPSEVYERMRDQLVGEKKSLTDQLAAVRVGQRAKPKSVDPDLLERWDELPMDSRKEILARLVAKIVVRPERPRSEVTIIPRWEHIP